MSEHLTENQFHERILENYKDLKSMDVIIHRYATSEDPVKDLFQTEGNGFPAKLFFKVFGFFERRAVSQLNKNQNNIENTNRAKKVIQSPAIKHFLCPLLISAPIENLIDSEKELLVIKSVTSLLNDLNLSKQFALNRDPLLFAYLAREILAEGIENYCAQAKES